MRYLLKKAKIVDNEGISSPVDILIVQGKIEQIKKNITDAKATIIQSADLHVSIGFCDIGCYIGEPGFEEREDIEHIVASAQQGGYTHLAPFPNLFPVTDSKSQVQYLYGAFANSGIAVHPIGALSKGCTGEQISEFVDMHTHGAIAFSDGNKSVQSTGLLLRALQYGKGIKTIIIQHPDEQSLSNNSHVHEGSISTMLGMPGNPVESELIMLRRDLEIAKYAEAPICMYNISTKKSVDVIKKAHKKNQEVYATVACMNLIHTDTDLQDFNPVYKVKPPLRSETERKGLIKGLKQGVISIITSNHEPVEPENKDLEFARSREGASTMDTVLPSLLHHLSGEIPLNILIDKLAYGPRKMLGLELPAIEVGKRVDICIFDPSLDWTVNSSNISSKSKNNPYIGQTLQGKVLGTIHNKQVTLQE